MTRVNAFAEASSMHGIKYVLSQNRIKSTRIFWTIALLCSVCGFCYYVYSGYNKFMYDPEIVMKARERPARDFPGPAISICSNLFARDNLANIFNIFHNIDKPINLTESNCTYLAANMHWCQPLVASAVTAVCGNYSLDNINIIKLINESALNVTESFYDCKGGSCDSAVLRVFTDFGICFVRNSVSFSSIFNTDVISDDFKCYLKFYEGKEDVSSWTPEKGYESKDDDYPWRATRAYIILFRAILNAMDKENLCALKNFRVYFHKPNEILTPFHESTYLNFDEYMEFRIFPKSHRTDEVLRRFNPDQRKCYFEGERQLRFFKTYTKAHCEWECKANATLNLCGCVKFSMPRDKTTKVCSLSQLSCLANVNDAQCDCYAPCIDISYSYKVDKTNFNRRLFDHTLGLDSIMSWFQVGIGTEIVEEIENFVSYKLQNFISDFGGLLGLFMGCSLLSIIEIFYYLFGGVFSLIFKRKPRQTTPIIQVQPTNTVELKSCSSQVSNNDILYAVNALNKTVHEIEMRFIKDIRNLGIKYENLEEKVKEIKDRKDINLDKSIKVNNKYDIKKILQTIEIEDL